MKYRKGDIFVKRFVIGGEIYEVLVEVTSDDGEGSILRKDEDFLSIEPYTIDFKDISKPKITNKFNHYA